jgi:hypothetical protein
MVTLDSMQTYFAKAIQAGPRDVQATDPAITAAVVAGNARLSADAQLEIYREQFWLRHVNALVEDFATLHHLLGHDGFQRLCEDYLAAHPPTDFSLRDLGAKLPAFVESHSPYREDRLLADCARIEWAFVDAFDAPDAPPLDVSMLATLPEESWALLRLELHPSLQRVSLAYPADDLRAQVKAGEDAPRPEPEARCVAVYRGPDALQYVEIEPLAQALLDRLAKGATLGAACDDVATTEAITQVLEARIGEWFQLWAARGWISRIET